MGFFNQEQKSMFAARQAAETKKKADEIEAFCQPANLQRIIGRLQDEVNNMIKFGTEPSRFKEVHVFHISARITDAVSHSERCKQELFNAVRRYEETAVKVDIDYFSDSEGSVMTSVHAYFSKSLVPESDDS